MDINSIMSTQLLELQQTVQLSLLDRSMNIAATGAIEMLQDLPQATVEHPFKGQNFDIKV